MPTGAWIGLIVFAALAGLVGGYFLARFIFKRQLKKNPPINRNMIKAMYMSMGKKPSEAQINATMNAMMRNMDQ
ncbi:MAG: YneF family protein [Bacilli bacterium]|nr:YneF family protein [Bacilli bacterium]